MSGRNQLFVLFMVAVLAAVFLPAAAGLADWPRNGVLISSLQAGYGTGVVATSDGTGGVLVGWTDSQHFWTTRDDVFLQRLRSDGSIDPAWPSAGAVVCDAPLTQTNLAICPDGRGGAFVGWMDERGAQDSFGPVNWPVYLQKVTPDGTVSAGWPAQGLQISPYSNVYAGSITVAPDGAGGSYVAWTEGSPGGPYDVYVQHISADGATAPGWPGRGAQLTARFGSRYSNGLLPDGSGGAYLCWKEDNSASIGIYLTRLSPSGGSSVGWPPDGVALFLGSGGHWPSIMLDGTAGVIATWIESVGATAVRAQRIGADAARDLRWPTEGVLLCSATDWRQAPVGVSDGVGGAIIAWADWRSHPDPNDGPDVYAQHVSAEGTIAMGWPSAGLRLGPISGLEWLSGIASDGSGGAYVAWTDYRDGLNAGSSAVAQHVLAAGQFAPGWTEDGIRATSADINLQYPAIVAGSNRDAILAVSGYGEGISPRVIGQRVTFYGAAPDLFQPRVAALAADRVRLQWHVPINFGLAVSIHRRDKEGSWAELGHGNATAAGVIDWEDATVTPGAEYEYRLGVPEGTAVAYYGSISLRIPLALYLRIVSANPGPVSPTVSVVLPSALPARLELYDVSGRLVETRAVTALGPGVHRIGLSGRGTLRSGIYFLRLAQGSSSAVTRFAIVR